MMLFQSCLKIASHAFQTLSHIVFVQKMPHENTNSKKIQRVEIYLDLEPNRQIVQVFMFKKWGEALMKKQFWTVKIASGEMICRSYEWSPLLGIFFCV